MDRPIHRRSSRDRAAKPIVLPFRLAMAPLPRFRDGALYGVVRDEMDVPYVVRARVER